jgi:DNA-3-methyladenine glycosylase II
VNATRLNNRTLLEGIHFLESKDRQLGSVLVRYGPPPLWEREQGFATLIYIILEQQVSLASAKAAYDKLLAYMDPLTPAGFLDLSDDQLKGFGFSRQKSSYGRNLANAILDKSLDLAMLAELDDKAAKARLMQVKGIGSWTADIYLLRALGRPDVWPGGDLALAVAVQRLKGLATRPSPRELDAISRKWKPWRAVAARMLWHYYLNWRE